MLARLSSVALFPAVDALAVTPEIFLRLYTGAVREIILHQGDGFGDGRGSHTVGPIAAEHHPVFTKGRHQLVQTGGRRGDDVAFVILVYDLGKLDGEVG